MAHTDPCAIIFQIESYIKQGHNCFLAHATDLIKVFDFQRNQGDDDERSRYEKDRIEHAKRIMKPFFLRRLKSEVLTDLPQKTEEVIRVPMVPQQQEAYFQLVTDYKQRAKEVQINDFIVLVVFNFFDKA